MSRVAWALVALLILTNAVWFLSRDTKNTPPPNQQDESGRNSGTASGNGEVPDLGLPAGPGGPGEGGSGDPVANVPRPAGPVDPAKAAELRKEWTKAVLDAPDEGRRQQAVENVYGALVSGDPGLAMAGLQTLPWIQKANFDKRQFRPMVEALLGAPDPRLRQSAVVAVSALEPEKNDIDLFIRMLRDPAVEVRKVLPAAMVGASEGVVEGIAGSAMIDFLHDQDLSVKLETLRALSQARRIGPEVIAILIPLCSSEDELIGMRALSALAGKDLVKDVPVVELLAGNLTAEDEERRARAREGLAHGVPESYGPQIADYVAPLLENQGSLADRQGNLNLLGEYGNETHIEAIERVANDESVPELVRRTARETIQRIRELQR